MRRYRAWAVLAAVAALPLAVGGCSSGKGGSSPSAVSASYNAGLTGVVNASDHAGGTVTYQIAATPDTLDPGNTSYGPVLNFYRLYARSLLAFQPAPGEAGQKLLPDLATGLGQTGDGGRTWTYHIRSGLQYSDGTPITTKDVKYAIERSNFAPDVLSGAAPYFHDYLVDNDPKYQGPYKDKAGGLDSIETPDDTTIVFHLNQPFAEFDYLVAQPATAPVPQAKDTGADYVKNIVSSGSYMFTSYQDGVGATLVKNPHWNAASDPIRKQLPDTIKVQYNIAQTTIDQNLIAGNITLDLGFEGLAASTQGSVLSNPEQKKHVDDTPTMALTSVVMATKVPPLDNVHCRQALEYAIDKVSVQTATGGDVHGDIATTILPPTVIGHTDFDLYATPGNKGANTPEGLAAAKDQLTQCGQPGGFTTNLAVQGDKPNRVAMAQAVQASAKLAGITINIQQYPTSKFLSSTAGAPSFVHDHGLGLTILATAPDWPTGYSMLYSMLAGSAIKPAGNFNISELDDPAINQAISAGIANTDADARAKAWGDIDKAAMQQAAVVPLLYSKYLLYRPDNATNVYVSPIYFPPYDIINVGTR